MPRDYYELLGVSEDATTDEIKEAYRERIKETHPDVSDDSTASERTKQLIEAKDVLTDDADRRQYDRIGHDQFSADTLTETEQTRRTNTTTASDGWQNQHHATSDRSTGDRNRQRTGRQNSETKDAEHSTTNSRREHSWQGNSNGSGRQHSQSVYQTWDSETPYAVGDEPEIFDIKSLFGSQQAIVFLGTTFVIYPVLLAGALFPPFPTAANITIAMCMVMVIGFLQSMPEIGIFVFGTWVVLLPIIAFGVIGISPFSLFGVLTLGAVLFPFGLSLLSYIAINPTVLG